MVGSEWAVPWDESALSLMVVRIHDLEAFSEPDQCSHSVCNKTDCDLSQALRIIFLPNRLHFEVKPFALLKAADDLEEVPRLRISVGT